MILAGAAGRSASMAPPTKRDALRDTSMKQKAVKMADKAQKHRNKMGRAGEGDRMIPSKKPKHLFSGKRGIGKSDRR
jgi:nucleolar GTP-binding protein